MHLILVLIVAGLVGAFIVAVVYFSVQSLSQGAVLADPLPLSRLKDHIDRDVAVRGSPEVEGGQMGPFGFPVIWYKVISQVYHSGHRNSGWRTVSTRERHHTFFLHFPDGGRVNVSGKPSEVHGAHSRTDGGGWLAAHGQRRTIHKWLPVTGELTVMGKLGLSTRKGATLMPSKKLGLLFTTAPPEKAAFRERLKGWGGLAASAGLAAGGVALILAVVG